MTNAVTTISVGIDAAPRTPEHCEDSRSSEKGVLGGRDKIALSTRVRGRGRTARPLFRQRSISQIAKDLGVSGNSLRTWVRQAQIDQGKREGLTTQEREELKRLRWEVKILRQEKEILKKAGGRGGQFQVANALSLFVYPYVLSTFVGTDA